nr:MerR family DNA-binding protein [Peribacillus saganii]
MFRGKRFGFQLEEIKELIHLFDHNRTDRRQLERTIEFGNEKLKEVKNLIEDTTRGKQKWRPAPSLNWYQFLTSDEQFR